MKLIVNQAYDNMGLQSTQTLGPFPDGAMRNTPEGRQFVRDALEGGSSPPWERGMDPLAIIVRAHWKISQEKSELV